MTLRPHPTRRLLLAAPALALLPVSVDAQSLSGAQRESAVASVNWAVNAVGLLQGRFAQTNPDGSSSVGAFWMQRPGRLRFEYDPPSPLVMVADGTNVAVRDARLNTTDRYPLRGTPLWLLLKSDVNLARDVTVLSAERRQGRLILTMRDRRREADGQLTLVFREDTSTLEEWTVRDGQQRVTRVRLVSTSVPAQIEQSRFALRDTPSRRKR